MARIRFPYFEIWGKRNPKRTPPFKEIDESYRSYSRIDGKFIPVGWYIAWSDGRKEVILDEDV